jgi:hypothetical protein
MSSLTFDNITIEDMGNLTQYLDSLSLTPLQTRYDKTTCILSLDYDLGVDSTTVSNAISNFTNTWRPATLYLETPYIFPEVSTSCQYFTNIFSFHYQGIGNQPDPDKYIYGIKIRSSSSSSSNYDARVVDYTNSRIIGAATFSNGTLEYGTIICSPSNTPIEPAVFEVHMRGYGVKTSAINVISC